MPGAVVASAVVVVVGTRVGQSQRRFALLFSLSLVIFLDLFHDNQTKDPRRSSQPNLPLPVTRSNELNDREDFLNLVVQALSFRY